MLTSFSADDIEHEFVRVAEIAMERVVLAGLKQKKYVFILY